MSGKEHVSPAPSFRIAEATRIGYVHLRVSDLERSLTFYLDVLGFRLVSGGAHTATLSANGRGPGLIVLTARKDAPARPPRTTGLYHLAIRVPSRRALAMVIRRLQEMQWPVQGYADHDVSEAVYLSDPDGIGIEVYADRPRDEWPLHNGQVDMVTEPLELDRVMRELETWPGDWDGIDPGTDIGHVHLRVSSLETASDFYHVVLGFDVTQRIAGAIFLSAGGYHHHIGANTWGSENAPRPPADAIGLISFGVFVPDAETLREVGKRVAAAGAPASTDEDGSLRIGDPDSIFIEFVVRH